MFGFQAALILATAGKLFGIVWPADTAMTTADRDELATKGDLYRALWIAIVASLGGLIAIAAALNLL